MFRLFSIVPILLVPLFLFAWNAADAAEPAKATVAAAKPVRNVIVIVADDLGMQLGCYGDKVIRSPNIDRLAADATRFTHAHCTTASCSASRSVILSGLINHATGHYGHEHGTGHFSTYDKVQTLPVVLGKGGYRTCSIGKYHVAPEKVYHFQQYRNEGLQGNRNTARMAANAKAFITEVDARPFFLYFCPSDPHRGGGPDLFANFNDDAEHYPGVPRVTYDPQAIDVPSWLPDTTESRRELAAYYQAISRVDFGVGQLMETLRETGHDKDTLVLLLSDNGPPFPGAKTTLYVPGMRLPLIVRNPLHPQPGSTTEAQVTWADLAPTIYEFTGVEPPKGLHGRSFLTAMQSERPTGWDEAYGSHTFHEITMYYPMRCIVRGRYKYILNLAHGLPYPFASDLYASPTWQATLQRNEKYYGLRSVEAYIHRPRHELYDLQTDPDELHNLAESAEHAQKLAELQKKLKAWQKRTSDPWITKYEYE
jgi:N-sulfoglucosamine sulfohydrolase